MINITPTFLFEYSNTAKGIPEGNDTKLYLPPGNGRFGDFALLATEHSQCIHRTNFYPSAFTVHSQYMASSYRIFLSLNMMVKSFLNKFNSLLI